MTPAEEYESERSRRRERAERLISDYTPTFLGVHFLGWLICCAGGTVIGTGGMIFAAVGIVVLLVSVGLALWLGIVTLRGSPLLSWRWRLSGLFPWAVICGESVLVMLASWSV